MISARFSVVLVLALLCRAQASPGGAAAAEASLKQQTALEQEASSFVARMKEKHGGDKAAAQALQRTLSDTSVLKKLKEAGCFAGPEQVSCETAVSTVVQIQTVKEEVNEKHKLADEAVGDAKEMKAEVEKTKAQIQEAEAAETKVEATEQELATAEHEKTEEQQEQQQAQIAAVAEKKEAAKPSVQNDPVMKEAETFKADVAETEADEQKAQATVKEEDEEEIVREKVVESMEEVTDTAMAKASEEEVASEEKKVEAIQTVASPAAIAPLETKTQELEQKVAVLPPALVSDEKSVITDIKAETTEAKEEIATSTETVQEAKAEFVEVKNEAQTEAKVDQMVDEFGTVDAVKEALDACPQAQAAAAGAAATPDAAAATDAAPAAGGDLPPPASASSFLSKKEKPTAPARMVPCPPRKQEGALVHRKDEKPGAGFSNAKKESFQGLSADLVAKAAKLEELANSSNALEKAFPHEAKKETLGTAGTVKPHLA